MFSLSWRRCWRNGRIFTHFYAKTTRIGAADVCAFFFHGTGSPNTLQWEPVRHSTSCRTRIQEHADLIWRPCLYRNLTAVSLPSLAVPSCSRSRETIRFTTLSPSVPPHRTACNEDHIPAVKAKSGGGSFFFRGGSQGRTKKVAAGPAELRKAWSGTTPAPQLLARPKRQ